MAKAQAKESKMVSYLIKNRLSEYLPEMISNFEQEHEYKFNRQDYIDLMKVGEEIIEAHFPSTSYNFSLPKNELKNFDAFIAGFVKAFLGALVCAMTAHMNLSYIVDKIENQSDDAA